MEAKRLLAKFDSDNLGATLTNLQVQLTRAEGSLDHLVGAGEQRWEVRAPWRWHHCGLGARCSELPLERVSPVLDRDGPTLLDHHLVRRDRRLLLGGLHLERRVRLGERDN
jgi:hypothetical protein